MTHRSAFWVRALALLGALVIAVGWVAARNRLDSGGRAEVRAMLESRLSVTETALQRWQDLEKATAVAWASNDEVVGLARSLLEVERTPASLRASPYQQQLRNQLAPMLGAHQYRGFFVIAPDGVSLGSARDVNTGTANVLATEQPEVFADLVDGQARVGRPQPSDVPLDSGDRREGDEPTMFIGAPIVDGGEVIAVLTFRLDPEATLGDVFTTQRWGRTGEALAVEPGGNLIVASRFHDALVAAGVVAEDETGFRTVPLAHPGVDLTTPAGPSTSPTSQWRPTTAARSVLSGATSSTAEGYPSYLGRPVVGAWTWEDELGLGVVVEIEEGEALADVDRAIRTLDVFAAAALAATVLVGLLATLEQRQRHRVEEVNDDLRRTQSDLRQANDDLTQFAHLAAHDLRAPSQRLRLLVDLAVRRAGPTRDPTFDRLLDRMADQASLSLGLLDGLRAITGVSGPVLERELVDLAQLVGGLADELTADRPGVTVHVDLTRAVSGYPPLLTMLYTNLLQNAARHGTEPCRIRCTEQPDGSYTVENPLDGGYDGDDSVFRPFERRTDQGEGRGLGLSICRRAVQRHGGRIWVEPADDRFCVRFTLGDGSEVPLRRRLRSRRSARARSTAPGAGR